MLSKIKLFLIMRKQLKREDGFFYRIIMNHREDNPSKKELKRQIRKLAGDLHHLQVKLFTLMNDSEDYELAIERNRIYFKQEVKKLSNPAELIKKAEDVTNQAKGLLNRFEKKIGN
ncbi:MAG: hypothetical protein E3J23_08565 [Candidatus Stahlbacteria bacterium]|nr:MAG: hypothetical protein E3J23_08565 [Candidatus Stahlbacteria bacterium]